MYCQNMENIHRSNFDSENGQNKIISLTTYAWKKVTILVGHFQKIDLFYDW